MNKLIPTLSLSALVLSGCATVATIGASKDSASTTYTEHDQIRYLAQTKDQKGLLLLGDKYSYTITDDAGTSVAGLNTIAQTLDPRYLHAKPVQVSLSKSRSHRVAFVFEYDKQGLAPSQSETAILARHCTQASVGRYNCQLAFNARLHPKQNPTPQMTPLKGNYPIHLSSKDGKMPVAYLALMPVALAFDVVTFPFQLLLFNAFENSK